MCISKEVGPNQVHHRVVIDGAGNDWLFFIVAQFLDFPEFGRFLSCCKIFLQIAETGSIWKEWRELRLVEKLPSHVHWVPREDPPLQHLTSELRRAYCTFHFLKGIYAYEDKAFDLAEDLFRSVLSVAPCHDQVMCRVADSLYCKAASMGGEERIQDCSHRQQQNRGLLLGDAKKLYEQALALNPQSSFAMNGLAALVDEPAERRRLLEQSVEVDPVNSYALANLGGEWMGIDDRRSLTYLDRALDINPQLLHARLHRSKILWDLGDLDGAIRSVTEHLCRHPKDDRAKDFLVQWERYRDAITQG